MKKVIVTGANSGIGEAIAEYFAKNNWQVALLGRNKERLDQVAERLPHSSPFVCDLANKQSIVECANEIKTQFASIDCLINNAGIFEAGSVEEDDDGLWDDHYSINL